MEMPQEIEVWYVLPAIRKAISEALLKEGLKQKEIAEKLQVSEAAVSQYVKSKRASEAKLPKEIKDKIRLSAKRVARSDGDIQKEIQKICSSMRKKKMLCRIHKAHSKADLKNCRICG